MSMGKKTLPSYVIVAAQSLGSSFSTVPTNTARFDRVCLYMNATGTPTGVLSVQASNDYNPTTPGAVAHWADVPLSLTALSGSPQDYFIDIQMTAIPWFRLHYVFTSGTGSLYAVISAKES